MGPVCGVRAVALAPNPSAYYLLPPRVLSTGSSCSRPAPEVCPSRPLSALERTARPPPPPAPIPPVLQPSPTVHLRFFASPSLVAGCANLRGRPHLSRDGAKPHRTFLPLPPSALEAHLRADAPTYLFFSLRRAGRGALATRRGHRGAAQGCARPATGTRRVAAAPAQTAPGPPVCMRAACVRDHLPRSRASTRPPCAACAPRGRFTSSRHGVHRRSQQQLKRGPRTSAVRRGGKEPTFSSDRATRAILRPYGRA